jgi:hypothetical protein
MSIGFPTAPLAFRLRGAGRGAVENPQPVQRFHYPARKPVQLIPTTAHAPMPIGEIGGSKATRAWGREGDHPACTSAARKVGETRPRGEASPLRGARGRAH